jgi:hypothetical protein
MTNFSQATFLKISAIAVAAPRLAGAMAASAGIDVMVTHPAIFIPAEIASGFFMAILEGLAIAYILGRWRLLQSKTIHWWTLLILSILLALTLPMVSAPYLFSKQAEIAINELFNNNFFWQFSWSFIVAAVPVLIVMAVGVASQDSGQFDQSELTIEDRAKLAGQKQPEIIIDQPKLTSSQGPKIVNSNGQLTGQKKINQRRQKVVNLTSQNYSQKEIAKRLKVSLSTVKNDLREVGKNG